MTDLTPLLRDIKRLEAEVARLKTFDVPFPGAVYTPLSAPLTSTSWDGDSYSTTAKTLIDLSAVFGVPAGVKAVYVRAWIRDSASALAASNWLVLSPNNTSGAGSFALFAQGQVDDVYVGHDGIVNCDTNGDIYYQIVATGANTMDVNIQIWGYFK